MLLRRTERGMTWLPVIQDETHSQSFSSRECKTTGFCCACRKMWKCDNILYNDKSVSGGRFDNITCLCRCAADTWMLMEAQRQRQSKNKSVAQGKASSPRCLSQTGLWGSAKLCRQEGNDQSATALLAGYKAATWNGICDSNMEY